VIKEILRVSAIVSSRLPLVPREDLVFREWVIPSGTPVGMNPRNILQDEKFFPEPTEFKPERWLIASEDGDAVSLKRKRELEKYFVAFGKGGRMCLGMG
jgi:cytochrome P450